MSLMSDDEVALGNDNRYKNFVAAFEKVLKQFEPSSDWPNLIIYLNRLKKCIESNVQFRSIPKRITVLKQLAECLHPALPSGVHLKTLTLYEVIFQIISKRDLQRDILLYSHGMFSLLPVAALPVKPVLLTLYESYFLPLGEALNPVLSGFLIGLFSALEEGADYYDRVITLLDNLANRIDEFYFYTSVWSSVNLVALARYPAITFVLNHFNKRQNIEDQFHLVGLSTEIMVSAVCTCLRDNEQPLVQRSILDFLVLCLPIHRKQLKKIQLIEIISATFPILLKRDMSLNRRIYTWFLGTNGSSVNTANQKKERTEVIDSSSYFVDYTQEILIESLKTVLDSVEKNALLTNITTKNDDNTLPSAWTLNKLIQILLVLVDKDDVGPNIIELVFMNYLVLIYEQIYQPAKKSIANNVQQENDYSETLKTFNILLDTLEPYFIWEYLTKNFDIILTEKQFSTTTLKQLCGIIDMLLDISSFASSTEIQSEHLPEMLYGLIEIMNNNIEKLTPSHAVLCIQTSMKILGNIIPTETNHHRSMLYRSMSIQEYNREENSVEDDSENEEDYFLGQIHPGLTTDQQEQDNHVIERLLHQMVRKVEKQMYQFSQRKSVQSSSKIGLKSINHIDKSIKLYKTFFHRFILTYFIDESQIPISDQFEAIFSILQEKTDDSLLTVFNRYQQQNEFDLKLNGNVQEYKGAFEDCCRLLIEFCSFSKQSSSNDPADPSNITNITLRWKEKSDLDDWLMDLCALSLCRTGYFDFQTISISVLTELFDSALKMKKAPELDVNNLSLFLDKTDFFRYLTAYLWEYLSEKYQREHNLQAAYSLTILHSMLPNNLCEELISQELTIKDHRTLSNEIHRIEECKRFFILWNSTRDLANITKSFEQCLIHALSVLVESSHSCLKTMVERSVTDCFIQGDMCRIFNALLIMLLHSDTTRESHRQATDDSIFAHSNPEIDNASGITFSLSSLDGYIGEDEDDEDVDENEIESEDTDKRKRSRAISSGNPNESTNQMKTSPQPTKFSSISSISQPIISNFLSFSPSVISRAMRTRVPMVPTSLLKNTDPSDSNFTSSSRSQSMPSDDTSSTIPIDPQDAYILFYTQSYDYHRVLLSLNIIERLIELLPQQLVHYLLFTSNIQTSPMNVQELFLKRCQTFHLSKENTREYQTYLYLLLNTLLIFTYTYQPQSQDIPSNCQVHIHSLIILSRICHELSTLCVDNHLLRDYVVNLFKRVSFQKIILTLLNRMINKRINFIKLQTFLHDQLIKQYLKEFLQLVKELILLEHIISSSTDPNVISQPLIQQTIFLSNILQCLKQISFIQYHRSIIHFVLEILPHCGSALKTISIRLVEQICRNLCFFTQFYNQSKMTIKPQQLTSFDILEYIIDLIHYLAYVCNYCLGQPIGHMQHFIQILCPQQWMKRMTYNANDSVDARQMILTKFSTIFSSLLFIWKSLSIDHTHSIWLGNKIKQIRDLIIEFLSSLTKSNGLTFIRTVVQYWSEYKRQQKSSKGQTDQIQTLTHILKSITSYSINDMIHNINELIRNPSKKTNSVVSCLQFLLVYLKEQKNVSIDCWTTLAVLFKECLVPSTSPSVTFLIIKILNIYIDQSPSLVEKRDVKDLQDITIKVLENCNTIVASSLEQTKWLRKNLQVRLAQTDAESSTTTDTSHESDHNPDLDNNIFDLDDTSSQSSNASLMALTILAEYAAKLLDTVYNLTDEKDRIVIPYLQNLVVNLMPYVRTHVLANAPSYRAASTLLMNISQYSYMKKAWKKEVFEQLFDPGFFQVDLAGLRSWKVIIENMFSNEKPISYRDLLTRINAVQIGLFISKEQEYEQRAMLIKRFAFVVFASEKNQSNRYSPDIFTCFTDLLKLPQVPIIHSQLFLFFRVLLVRLSNKNFMTFWPTVLSELIQVFLQIEQDLLSELEGDTNKSNLQRMTMNDISLTSIPNASLRMYLYACKLLDILLVMPYSEVDYFQLVRSTFLADYDTNNQTASTEMFVAFSSRLVRLFERKLQTISDVIREQLPMINPLDCPLLRLRNLSNSLELYPFFHHLISYENNSSPQREVLSDHIETNILEDFIEF